MRRHDRHVRCYPRHGASGLPDGRSQFVHSGHHLSTLLVGSDRSGVEIDNHKGRSTRLNALEGVESSAPTHDFLHDLVRDTTRMLHGLIILVFNLGFRAQLDSKYPNLSVDRAARHRASFDQSPVMRRCCPLLRFNDLLATAMHKTNAVASWIM